MVVPYLRRLSLGLCLGTVSGLSFALGFALPLSVPSASAQERSGCYLTDKRGRRIDLGKLCGVKPLQTPVSAPIVPSVAPSKEDENPYVYNPVPTGKFYVIPIKRRARGIPIVEVTFNEKHRLEMMFDTGASGTLITSSTASALGLKVRGSGYATLADGRKSPFFVAPVRSVYAGNTRPRMLMVAISNTADIGLLGQDFFGDFDIKIRLNSIELHPR
jgi:hypothetical protein